MIEEDKFSIKNKEFLKNRVYYEKIPKHVLLLPDGGRRFGYKKGLTDMEIYDIGQKVCQDFAEVCINEFCMDIVTIFFLRPSSFNKQRRTEKNLKAILIAINKFAKNVLEGKTDINPSEVWVNSISLAGKEWMAKPERIQKSQELSKLWNELKKTMNELKSKGKKKKKIIFLLNYSGKKEIDEALKKGGIQIPEQIGLAIRTGDGMRLSDCPLYALSGSHFYLIPKFLPEVSKEDFRNVLNKFYEKTK